LSVTQTDLIAADIAANTGSEDGEFEPLDVDRAVMLVDKWGDVSTWIETGCEGGFSNGSDFWNPSAEAEEVLADALS
jgi:hypothetical protein